MERLKPLANARSCIVAISLLLTAAALTAAPTQTYYFFAFNNPVAGQEDEFNRWYNEQHLADIVATPGFVTAQRFIVVDEGHLGRASLQMPKYLAIYKIVTDDVTAAFAEMSRRGKSGEAPMSPSFDGQTNVSYTYRVFRAEIKGVGGEPAGAKSGSKQSYIQIVLTAPIDGKEDEYNAWYDEMHAPDLAASPGIVSTQRMILERPPKGIPATKYLALSKIETSDIAVVLKKLAEQPPKPNPALDRSGTQVYIYRAIGPVMEGDKVRAARASK